MLAKRLGRCGVLKLSENWACQKGGIDEYRFCSASFQPANPSLLQRVGRRPRSPLRPNIGNSARLLAKHGEVFNDILHRIQKDSLHDLGSSQPSQ